MFLVIGVHWVGSIETNCPNVAFDSILTCGLDKLNSLGVPVFFALSGYYLLAEEHDDILAFYRGRFKRVIIPYLIYAVIYVTYFVGIEQHTPEKIPLMYVVDLLTANVHGTHWFVYSILGLYLATPFLAKMFSRLRDSEVAILFGVGLSLGIAGNIARIFGYDFGISDYTFTGNLLCYISGYCMNRLSGSPGMRLVLKYKWIICAGLYILICISGFSSLYTAIAGLILAGNKDFEPAPVTGRIITVMSEYSYTTYLIHAAVISLILRLYRNWTDNYVLKLIAGYFIVYSLSFCIVFVIDNTVTRRIVNAVSDKE